MNIPFPLIETERSEKGLGMYFNDESFLKFFDQTVNLVWNSSQD
jgi:hypothetical protein